MIWKTSLCLIATLVVSECSPVLLPDNTIRVFESDTSLLPKNEQSGSDIGILKSTIGDNNGDENNANGTNNEDDSNKNNNSVGDNNTGDDDNDDNNVDDNNIDDNNPVENNPDENNPGENNPGDNTPDENNPGDNTPDENKPGDNNPDENNPIEIHPEENNPDDNNPDENNPDENYPGDNNPDENNPGDNNPDENNPVEIHPDGNNPDDNKPDENNPDDNSPDHNKPDENKPDENKPDENNPDDNSPDHNKPDENNPGDNNPDENNPDPDHNSDENNADNNNPEDNTTTDTTVAETTGTTTISGVTATTTVTSGTPAPDSDEAEKLIVKTEKGPVRGIQWPGTNEILAYLDIPYGKYTDIFKAPIEYEPWTETLAVPDHNKRCPQLDGDEFVGDTDCLTLSIFTPPNPKATSVLFYIHESNFVSGSGDPSIYGPEYLVPKNIILVLPNYRLGALGFLCQRDSQVPGNAALKDLALALQWTKNNIEAFGGDPSNIAVGGDGTSAALAGYLAVSPTSRHLIAKVIADSGSVLSHWAIDRNPLKTAEKVANSIGKNNNGRGEQSKNLLENINVKTLLQSAKDIQIRPCIENEGFLTDTPWKILQTERFNATFIIGSANHAGLEEALQHNEESITEMRKNFAGFLPNDLVFANTQDKNYIGERLMRQYFSDGNITLLHTEGLSLYHSDASYLGPSVRMARALAGAGATVFLYEFSFVGLLNKELMGLEGAPAFGAMRGDIVGYLFAQDSRALKPDTAEERIVSMMAELWASFLKTCEPTSSDFTWQPINATAENWLAIGADTTPELGFHVDRLQLWSDIYRHHFVDNNTASGLNPHTSVLALAFLYLMGSILFHTV